MFILELKPRCYAGSASSPKDCRARAESQGRRRPGSLHRSPPRSLALRELPLPATGGPRWSLPAFGSYGGRGVCMLLQQGAARSRRAGARGVSSLAVPRPPYLPRTKVGTMDLDRVTLLSALAGQDLVPEQALQVQEADEAGRGSSGG